MAGLGASLGDKISPISALLYGPEGTGKTTDALRMTGLANKGQKVLLVDAEGGAKVEALRQRGVDVDKVETWPESGDPGEISYDSLKKLATDLRGNAADYVGVVWDSGSEISKRILDGVVEVNTANDLRKGKSRTAFQINLEDHGVASSMLRDLLRRYRDLPIHFVITALERRDVDQDSGRVKYGPAMGPAMANDTAGLVDVVGYTMVDVVAGEEIRSASFVPVNLRRAKDRYGMLPGKLADPYFDRLHDYIRGTLTRDNDPVQAHVRELAASLNPQTPAPQTPAAPAEDKTPAAAEGEKKKEAANA